MPVVFAVSGALIDLLVDAGDDATVDDLVHAMAGGRGRRWHRADGRRPGVPASARIATSVCRALAYAHAHGVLHLEVKPANVLFAGDGRVLLADFGGDTRGTAGFAAPEVERGGAAVDERADVYGIAVLLAAMLGPGPSPLARVVARAMAAEVADRYASVDELTAALHDPVVPALPADSATARSARGYRGR